APNGVVPTVAARSLQLCHHRDPAAAEVEHLLEQRIPVLRARRVVRDDQAPVAVAADVELDVVGAVGDRPLEGGERVLRLVPGRAAVRDHEHFSGTPDTLPMRYRTPGFLFGGESVTLSRRCPTAGRVTRGRGASGR